jgi:hypothetical protein
MCSWRPPPRPAFAPRPSCRRTTRAWTRPSAPGGNAGRRWPGLRRPASPNSPNERLGGDTFVRAEGNDGEARGGEAVARSSAGGPPWEDATGQGPVRSGATSRENGRLPEGASLGKHVIRRAYLARLPLSAVPFGRLRCCRWGLPACSTRPVSFRLLRSRDRGLEVGGPIRPAHLQRLRPGDHLRLLLPCRPDAGEGLPSGRPGQRLCCGWPGLESSSPGGRLPHRGIAKPLPRAHLLPTASPCRCTNFANVSPFVVFP